MRDQSDEAPQHEVEALGDILSLAARRARACGSVELAKLIEGAQALTERSLAKKEAYPDE